ncbi:hypothetical protein SAMN02745146_2900 [Hymenobacter daecheongensis DSM 21074]|uniref:4-amino-4-deoxy-L-arabinose transferase n=1 Tax=Hymenobacter daecheongensis DSM 21074 TaxID=1121955 RepID=A0A1M6IME6_9BACT|nr:hypothetical protein [Hymenobacter daecheongensis]SHJ35661.1 hypothetical protein SAMN02745146_2900 [Hymenobacter daecheongensis DSM 21074]
MLLSKQYSSRGPILLALATMLVLLVFAWHFYMERSAYYDLSYHLLIYLKDKSLFVQNRRFVAIVTQWPTLMAIKAGWSMDAVLRLYSVVFVLYYLAAFLLCAYWLRNEQVALVVVLLFVLLASRTFYWAQSELPQALTALLLFYAGIARQAPVRLRFSTLALAALIPVFIFGHPLCIIAFLFIWSYDWLLNRRYQDWAYYGLLALALAMYKLRVMLIPPGSYEATHMTFTPNLIKYFPHYLSLESFHNFWKLCGTGFLALPVLLLALSAFYVRQGTWLAWLRLALVWAFVGGYTFIVNVSNPDYTEATYLENLYLPLTLFVAIPFAMELLPALERSWRGRGPALASSLLAVVLVARLGAVWYQHVPYTAYQQWLKQLMAYTRQFSERKFIMYPDNIDPHRLRVGWPWWAMASETMMVSARNSPDSAQTVQVGWEVERLAEAGAKPEVVLGPFETFTNADLPANYLRFASTPYRVLNTQPPQDTAALRPYIAAHQQVSLALATPLPATLPAGKQHKARIRVSVPAAAQPLHSGVRGPHPTLVRTAFYQDHDWPSDTEPTQVALEVDVWQPWTQTIGIQPPHKPGHYICEISLISLNYRAWPVRLRVPVEVVD